MFKQVKLKILKIFEQVKLKILNIYKPVKLKFLYIYKPVKLRFLYIYKPVKLRFLYIYKPVKLKILSIFEHVKLKFLYIYTPVKLKFLSIFEHVKLKFLHIYTPVKLKFLSIFEHVKLKFLHIYTPIKLKFLKIYKPVKLKVEFYKDQIKYLTRIFNQIKDYGADRLQPWILWRNILFLYSVTPFIFIGKYLLIIYFNIKVIYPIFYITCIISFLVSCILTIIIQHKWYAIVKETENLVKKNTEMHLLQEAIKKHTTNAQDLKSSNSDWPKFDEIPKSIKVPFAHPIKIIIIIFAIIAFILGFDHLILYLFHKSLLLVIITAVIKEFLI